MRNKFTTAFVVGERTKTKLHQKKYEYYQDDSPPRHIRAILAFAIFGLVVTGSSLTILYNSIDSSRRTAFIQRFKTPDEYYQYSHYDQAHALNPGSRRRTTTVTSLAKLDGECLSDPMHTQLATSSNQHLKVLAEYEAVCQSALGDYVMVFMTIPTNSTAASELGRDMAAQFKQFKSAGIKPLVIAEPTLSFASFAAGKYDQYIVEYHKKLDSLGVTDDMLGLSVPFPEANLSDEWTNAQPEYFGPSVTHYLTAMKQVFPKAKGSILLNASTVSGGGSWDAGLNQSWAPYLAGLDKSLLYSIGMQGFPWQAPKGQIYDVMDANRFLDDRNLLAAANALGIKRVWLNTGIMKSSYTNTSREVTLSALERQQIAEDMLAQIKVIKNHGLDVEGINIFAEDKSNKTEAVDWSFWQRGTDPTKSPDSAVFALLVKGFKAQGIDTWIYDN